MKHFRDAAGVYQGQTNGQPKAGWVECPEPGHGLQEWNGAAWVDTPALVVLRAKHELETSDQKMGRVIEDILSVLIAKGIMATGDLPAEARAVLDARAANRGKL